MRLIDADALLTVGNVRKVTQYNECGWGLTYHAVPEQAVKNAPTIDAIPVVRCRDCMHCLWDELHKDKKGRCMEHHLWCEPDGFCHMGAKMDGGSE